MKRDKAPRHASAVNAALQLNWSVPNSSQSEMSRKWQVPSIQEAISNGRVLSEDELTVLAESYIELFLPFFTNQTEGSINPQIILQFSSKMKQKLGLAYLFEHKIRLNLSYFRKDPSLLPYTLFHEMTHIWLYDCMLDPGHTKRFYNKMSEFQITGLAVDLDLHVHRRIAPEGKFVYICPNCSNRWFMRERLRYTIFCGHCFDREGIEYFAIQRKQLKPQSDSGDIGSAA
jgi:predicted SprT family Zn-dependent metalloprotease